MLFDAMYTFVIVTMCSCGQSSTSPKVSEAKRREADLPNTAVTNERISNRSLKYIYAVVVILINEITAMVITTAGRLHPMTKVKSMVWTVAYIQRWFKIPHR